MSYFWNANIWKFWKFSILLQFFSLQANDYIESYFDNGEDFAADSDDNMDGEATYWDIVTQPQKLKKAALLKKTNIMCLLPLVEYWWKIWNTV